VKACRIHLMDSSAHLGTFLVTRGGGTLEPNRNFGIPGYNLMGVIGFQSINWRISSRSLLCIFHRTRQCHKTRQFRRSRPCPHHLHLNSLNGNAEAIGFPPSWLVFSLTHVRSHAILPKMTTQKLIRPTHPQKYLEKFKSQSSLLCPLKVAGNHTYRKLWRKNFQMLRLGSFDSPLLMNDLLLSAYSVF